MSLEATKWVWNQLNFASSEKVVLLRLAEHAGPRGEDVFPSVASVAVHTGLSERQVQRYIKSFVQRGILEVVANATGGRGKTTEYRFTFINPVTSDTYSNDETPTPVSPIRNTKSDTGDECVNAQRVTSRTGKGDTGDRERVTPETVKGDTYARAEQEPSKNHQQEPSGNRQLPRNGVAQVLVAELCDALGIDQPTNYKQTVGQAAQLAKAGCTPQELREITTWLQADTFWSRKGIDMGTVLSQRDKWRASRNTPPSSVTTLRQFPQRTSNSGQQNFTDDDLIAIARGEISV